VTVKAAIEIRDVLNVWIEFRAPKKGELSWSVPAGASPQEALEHVLVGRDEWSTGEAGFGYHAHQNMPEFDTLDGDPDFPTRNIIVHVDHVRTEPHLSNVIPLVKLL
jgi:hypothetical protein